MAEGESPKVDYVLRRARALAASGQKVLIWTSFVRNVELLASRLADVGAVYIHGGVGTGDSDDDDTREGRIRAFREDDSVRVLVANPAAASESISLHMICHHAIYLDRTFNAGHFLQSQDRIHRLGLKPTDETHIEIVESLNTVDQTIRLRLDTKIRRMADVLEDSSLHVEAVPFDPDLEDDDSNESDENFNDGDIIALTSI